jgi:hypothetical protein
MSNQLGKRRHPVEVIDNKQIIADPWPISGDFRTKLPLESLSP